MAGAAQVEGDGRYWAEHPGRLRNRAGLAGCARYANQRRLESRLAGCVDGSARGTIRVRLLDLQRLWGLKANIITSLAEMAPMLFAQGKSALVRLSDSVKIGLGRCAELSRDISGLLRPEYRKAFADAQAIANRV